MSSEPLSTTPISADTTATASSAVASAEKGLLIAMLVMVLLGTTAIFLMN